MTDTLLIELLTEELPPKSLALLGERFAEGIVDRLRAEDFLTDASTATNFATPRRIAVSITHVQKVQPERRIERKGPAVKSGVAANGEPTPALLGFARSCGTAPEALERVVDGKSEYFVFRSLKAGEPLDRHLDHIVGESIKSLPIPKLMRWGNCDAEFARPVHGLVMLHGSHVVPGAVLGQESGNRTQGHRFMGRRDLVIRSAADYETKLEQEGKVIASCEKRRQAIEQQLLDCASNLGGHLNLDERGWLLDEVTALVEYPAVYIAKFDEEFLAVPQECLILTMQQNQKYFPLFDGQGKLLPKFLIVSNMEVDDPSAIIDGNQRVVRPRLADARFFFQQDRKETLDARVPWLADIVFHNKLGSQLDRVRRVTKVAAVIAGRLGANAGHAERAAHLCKADLLTGMVGEFPELQGIMGTYYARHDGEPEPVAQAIEAHYHPRFANDSLPDDNVAAAVALADKLDTLVGIFGIGLGPTGDKDPFALRRHALGVLRILFEKALPLDLMELLTLAKGQFPAEVLADSIVVDVHLFMLERLRNYLREREFDASEIDAVASQHPTRIDLVLPRLAAVRGFRRLPESESLAVANKRIRNILRKTEAPSSRADLALLAEPAEKTLFDALTTLEPKVASLLANEDYDHALRLLATAREPVDRFFDEVLVMCDEPLIRANRLALLKQLGDLMNQVADISKLAA
ncbi:MAG: glycine--tRNA ligase subunit beta [Burkholderiales bacterium]